jgi:hypothetical protein
MVTSAWSARRSCGPQRRSPRSTERLHRPA